MPGRIASFWPPWPQFSLVQSHLREGDVATKQQIIAKYGADAVRKSWIDTCKALEATTDNIRTNGTSIIPDLQLDEILSASPEKKEELKSVGCIVVRGVISKMEATKWYHDLKSYAADNKEAITGWPQPDPYMFNVYHSPTQQAARSHPNSLAVQRALLSLWHDTSDPSTSFQQPLSYADGFRIRAPNTKVFTLPPHVDAGSLSRWADPTYVDVYSAIWSGNPSQHDAYDLSLRKDAKSGLFPGANSSVLRAFQGWTAITEAGTDEGSLMVYPNIHAAVAYMFLRPLFVPPETQADVMDAEKWTLSAENAWFPGTYPDKPQMLSPVSHPHLCLDECMVNIPRMYPGDTVWWHADTIHAVDLVHNGEQDSAVLYIAATPSTPENVRYIQQQAADFKAGIAPEDFRDKGTDETKFKGYLGESGVLNGVDGRKAAGLEL